MLLKIFNHEYIRLPEYIFKHSNVLKNLVEDCSDVDDSLGWDAPQIHMSDWRLVNCILAEWDKYPNTSNHFVDVTDAERDALRPYGPTNYEKLIKTLEIGDYFDMPRVVHVASKIMAEILEVMTDTQLVEFSTLIRQ
ncbi:hypothetical protein GGF31_003445 [Allomyces arbusculus]|nr:hypothetical protein GGF31_003445 [Allomyces arbusculus]